MIHFGHIMNMLLRRIYIRYPRLYIVAEFVSESKRQRAGSTLVNVAIFNSSGGGTSDDYI